MLIKCNSYFLIILFIIIFILSIFFTFSYINFISITLSTNSFDKVNFSFIKCFSNLNFGFFIFGKFSNQKYAILFYSLDINIYNKIKYLMH